jgi:hypothetical protein
MKSIRIFVALLACVGCYGCAGVQRFLHGDPVVSGAPEINDNVFLLRNNGDDEETYTDTGKVVPAPCKSFMRDPAPASSDSDAMSQATDMTGAKAQGGPPQNKDIANVPASDARDPKANTSPKLGGEPNQIRLCVYAMHNLIDVRWHRFEHEVSATLSTSNFLADVSVLGLTTASTLASVDSAKILSAIAAGVTGARKSWDEDILYSYSIQEILQQMRTDRALADTQIQARLAPTGRPYDNIDEAANDLFNYDVAGSWEHAMSSLQLSVAATTAACQARLRNQQMASAAGTPTIAPLASTATDPCNSIAVAARIVIGADITKGAIFMTKDGHTIKITTDVEKGTGKFKYDTWQPQGWPDKPADSDVTTLLPNLNVLLLPGAS